MFVCAYQVQCRNNVGLIRLGSHPLPGAVLLKAKFAWIFALQGLAFFGAALGIYAAIPMQLTAGALFVFWVALMLRRGILVSGIEKYANEKVRIEA